MFAGRDQERLVDFIIASRVEHVYLIPHPDKIEELQVFLSRLRENPDVSRRVSIDSGWMRRLPQQTSSTMTETRSRDSFFTRVPNLSTSQRWEL